MARNPAPATPDDDERRRIARDAFDRDDPHPEAVYDDRDLRVARALLVASADDGAPAWDSLRMRGKRIALMHARQLLSQDSFPSRLARALLDHKA